MSEVVRLQIKIDDNGSFKNVEVNAEDLSKVIKQVKDDVDQLSDNFVKNASKMEIWQGVASMIGQIQGVMTELTSAYTVQSSAETRLAQAMHNTMGASQEEVNSIKELCSAQQQLGIIGDEVQLAGAQELATYLTMSSSLMTLIPVMNDMTAQQYGFNASAESATQIAAMLGKVMNGQTEALSRYGYKFDEAQKYILKYGDEEERVAVLADVVREAVGGMNEKMADTPEGHLAQWKNKLGDLKEIIGSVVIGLQKYVDTAAGLGQGLSGIRQLNIAWKQFKDTQTGTIIITKLSSVSLRLLKTSGLQAAMGVNTAKVAVAGLNAVLSIGIIGLISALVTGLLSLFTSSKKAAGGIEDLNEATKAYRDASSEARGALAKEIVDLEALIKSHGDETAKIKELNEKYGEIFGAHQTAAEWYDILTNKSKDYCRQLGYEAAAKKTASELGALYVEKEELQNKNKELQEQAQSEGRRYLNNKEIKESVRNRRRIIEINKEISEKEPKLEQYTEGANKASKALHSNDEPMGPEAPKDYNKLSINQLKEEEKIRRDILSNQTDATSQEAQNARTQLANIHQVIKAKEKSLGLDKQSSNSSSNTNKNKYDGSKLIENAKTYKELGNNIKYYENALESADITESERLTTLAKSLAETKKKQEAIKEAKEKAILEANKPESPKSLEEVKSLKQIDEAIEYQKKLSVGASVEKLQAYNAEIQRLQELREAFEDSTHVDLTDEQITSFKQLQGELDFYTRKLQSADAEERKIIQGKINHLQELQKQWQRVLNMLNKPGDISSLNTIEELEDAITWYTAKQKTCSKEEALAIQQTIDALNRKKEAQEALYTLPAMQREVGELNGLQSRDLEIRLRLIGLDTLQSKIRSLQALLNDIENPVDASQRKEIESLIASYKKYEGELKRSDVSLVQGWQNIKGITGGIESMNQALKEEGSAWKKITAVVDGAIQIYQSLSGIIEIMKALTGVTEAQTVLTTALGEAKTKEAVQDMAATNVEVKDSAQKTGAALTEATAKTASSAAGYFETHSEIPFVGFAIAAAFVAAMLGVMLSLPKFAEGGIAYGPTLGIFGEYSGASTNPEVVAPLDKLRDIIGGEGVNGRVMFRIQGRTLVGILEKESQYKSRTR